jgi:hypothetical protein
MFRIRYILIRIRRSGFQENNKKQVFFSFSAYFITCTVLIVGKFTLVIKDSKSLRSHKIVEIKVFCWWKDPDLDPDPHK